MLLQLFLPRCSVRRSVVVKLRDSVSDTLTDGNLKEVENEEEKKIRFVSDEEINEEQEDENTHLVDVSEEKQEDNIKNQNLQQTIGHKESSSDMEEDSEQDIMDETQELNAECIGEYVEELKDNCEEQQPDKKLDDRDQTAPDNLVEEENQCKEGRDTEMNKEFEKCVKILNEEDECGEHLKQDMESNGLNSPTNTLSMLYLERKTLKIPLLSIQLQI
ncbi:uncharacterized protein LOC143231673 [Tachypleus tridentatus]|uniref:uncharacterized protein LOC143231673 n=1 Tax=Tachypleus tridentatus TaxID=6853 RepID=UPI003FD46CA4